MERDYPLVHTDVSEGYGSLALDSRTLACVRLTTNVDALQRS